MSDKRILALDLGGGAFKMALIGRRDGTPVIAQLRLLELPPAANEATRQAALKELLEGIPLGRMAQVVSVVDDPFACARPVTVPPMPAGEMAGAARWELQRHLAVSPEEVMVDYEPAGEEAAGGSRKMRIWAVALPKEAVRNHLAFLAAAGVKPTHLVPKACALAAWARQGVPEKGGPAALLLMGADSSEFVVAQEGRPLFTRKVPVSGRDLTKGMTGTLVTGQGQMSLTEAEAETIKRSLGIPQGGSPEISAKGISPSQLLALLRGNLERLAAEVERSIVFCGESVSGANIQALVLTGGGAHLKGLPDWLADRLKIRVTVPDPLQGFEKEPGALQGPAAGMSLSLIPVLGAALRAGRGVNLLPAEMKQAIQARIQKAALTGLLAAGIAGALLTRIGMGVYEKALEAQVAAFELERSAVAPEFASARAAAAVREQQRQQPQWEEVFKDLSQAVPREIYLTGLTVHGLEATLRGRARESSRPADQVLADFQRALGEGLFGQPRLASSRQMEDAGKETEFEIRCLLK